MRGLAIALLCCCVAGCGSRPESSEANATSDASPEATMSYREQQKHLFHEIDHKLVYQGCQELLQLHRDGKLSSSTFFCDDPDAKLSELPRSIRLLQPASISVTKMMVVIRFLNEGRMQILMCAPDDLTQALQYEGRTKGWGYCVTGATEKLSGTESLDYLNEQFAYFEVELPAGLSYGTTPPGETRTLEQVKAHVTEETRQGQEGLAFMEKTIEELAIKVQRLLYRTDHQELLKACRESIKRFNEGVFSTSEIYFTPPELKEELESTVEYQTLEKNLKHIPQIILDLKPGSISFDESRMIIAFIGGLSHAGVMAYLNEGDAVPRDDDMELIPGLRYYDDGIREGGDDYRRYLKSLEDEAVPYADWAAKQTSPSSLGRK